jgi:predicted transcriptional regulator
MEMVPVTPERKAQLEDYAQRSGQDTAAVLDDALAAYLDWEEEDFEEAVQATQEGYEDVLAGRTRPAAEFLAEMRQAYGLSG